jgi:hypothetical protein
MLRKTRVPSRIAEQSPSHAADRRARFPSVLSNLCFRKSPLAVRDKKEAKLYAKIGLHVCVCPLQAPLLPALVSDILEA